MPIMRPHDYKKNAAKVVFPCYMQPKVNGVRAQAHRTEHGVVFFSRLGKEFSNLQNHTHLLAELLLLMLPGQVWDGEIYKHGWKLQDIVSALKTPSDLTKQLEYHVFDVVDLMGSFYDRRPVFKEYYTAVKAVPTVHCEDVQRLEILHSINIKLGYEGSIIRNVAGKYEAGKSFNVLKYKKWYDAEFKIVGNTQCSKGGIIFVCAAPAGKVFKCKPVGTIKHRQKLLGNAADHVGKLLTVRYQELSNSGIPLIPTGLILRDYE